MTNVEGLELLFVALFLFAVCLVASVLVAAVVGWERLSGRPKNGWFLRARTAVAILGLGVSTVAWIFALWFMTPGGVVERLLRPNPVLMILLLGYTLPAILGGVVLWNRDRRDAGYQLS